MKRNSSKPKRRYGDAGFTLVELVVVIAVLAILAGVGAVAYTGYIEYTNKGLDRQTVGEVMHALELADYANPELFGENGGAMVILTTNGVQVAGGLEGSDLKGALEDAFGEGSLSSTKLAYDGWSGKADMSVFNKINTSTSAGLKAYYDSGKTASFANNIDDLWNTVNKMVGLMGGTQQHYVGKMIDVYSGIKESDMESFANRWTNDGGIRGEGTFNGQAEGAAYLALSAARNYSFYWFAKDKVAGDASMAKELEDFKASIGSDGMTIMDFDGEKSDLKTGTNSTKWAEIFNSYRTTQAAVDAKAFSAIMDAAAAAAETAGLERNTEDGDHNTYYSHEDLMDMMSDYVGIFDNIITNRVKVDELQELASDVTGNIIVINARKENGALVWDDESVSPKEANPRLGNDGASSTVEYTQDNAAFTIGDWSESNSQTASGSVVLAPGSSCTFKFNNPTGAVDLTNYTWTAPDGITVQISGTSVTVTSTGDATSGQIVLTGEANFTGKSNTITINVEVK